MPDAVVIVIVVALCAGNWLLVRGMFPWGRR